jgi:hypothetical protein
MHTYISLSISHAHDPFSAQTPAASNTQHNPVKTIHKYIHACIHAHINTYSLSLSHTHLSPAAKTCVHTHIRTCIHTYTRTYMNTYIHAYVLAHIHTSASSSNNMHVYTHTYTLHMYTCIHTYTHAYTPVSSIAIKALCGGAQSAARMASSTALTSLIQAESIRSVPLC